MGSVMSLCNPMDYIYIAHQVLLSMGFSRQEHWSELPFPLPGDLLNPRMKPMSPEALALAGRPFTTEPPGKPNPRNGLMQLWGQPGESETHKPGRIG